MRILVIGATGGTGRGIVREALTWKWDVNALVRSRERASAAIPEANLVEGDALDAAATRAALAGCDGVIGSLGSKLSPFRKVMLLSTTTRILIDAMRQMSVRRLVCITGMGPAWARATAAATAAASGAPTSHASWWMRSRATPGPTSRP